MALSKSFRATLERSVRNSGLQFKRFKAMATPEEETDMLISEKCELMFGTYSDAATHQQIATAEAAVAAYTPKQRAAALADAWQQVEAEAHRRAQIGLEIIRRS